MHRRQRGWSPFAHRFDNNDRMTDPSHLVLASGSPRRRVLLRRAGFDFSVVRPDVDETQERGESAAELVSRLAESKAIAVAQLERGEHRAVLAADTVVAVHGDALGKPDGPEQAVEMLLGLSDRSHQVITGYCLYAFGPTRLGAGVTATSVRFKGIDRAAAEEYVATGEPLDKAGAYAIQGLGRRFVAEITGSFTNVMGLPMEDVTPLLVEHGIRRATTGN